ncbi:MAG: glutamate-5-semialdehyde dehydrogenase [Acidibacillus sp.]|nr:glutamate-5-semialdehyde dehydrogenase [Acidibacillus sp.]
MRDELLRARAASRLALTLTSEQKNMALHAMGEALIRSSEEILLANQLDVQRAQDAKEPSSRLDRLALDKQRMQTIVDGLHDIISLADPIGEVLSAWTRPNGLYIEQVRVPLGVVGVIYESRPNVTVDTAALTLKTGNAVVLRGGKEAFETNTALTHALRKAITEVGLPADLVMMLQNTNRSSIDELIRARGLIDVIIPRGGAGLITHVVEHATVPVIETGVGNCHVYVDVQANIDMAIDIIINAKTQRPSVCNAIETVLIHEAIAKQVLPRVSYQLAKSGVQLRVDEASDMILENNDLVYEEGVFLVKQLATDMDYATEFLGLTLAVKIVPSLENAIDHIMRYGTGHSESIITEDIEAAEIFLQTVDAAAVYHNASTRFTDGYEFGFGAEIGISTQKLHARGPMGLRELTGYKYMVRGNGQIR